MVEATTTVTVDEQGRLYLPKPVRTKLGIESDRATVEIDIRYDGGADE